LYETLSLVSRNSLWSNHQNRKRTNFGLRKVTKTGMATLLFEKGTFLVFPDGFWGKTTEKPKTKKAFESEKKGKKHYPKRQKELLTHE
jgi:hypothetical protein